MLKDITVKRAKDQSTLLAGMLLRSSQVTVKIDKRQCRHVGQVRCHSPKRSTHREDGQQQED